MSEYRLVMKGVVKTFPGVKALDHAQLELRPGNCLLYTSPSPRDN